MLDNHFLRLGGLQLYLCPICDSARVCVGMHVCVEGRANVSLAAVASACESSFSLLNPGYNSVEDC